MSRIPFVSNPGSTSSTTKFDTLNFNSNSLFLKYQDNPEIAIPFDAVEKIYIKKHKLNPFLEFTGISIPFLMVYLVVQYWPSSLLIFISIVAILPIFLHVINYKRYRLYIRLNDGSSYRKKISMHLKTESFSVLEKVRAEYMSYNYNASALAS
jgi:hypothetical protein